MTTDGQILASYGDLYGKPVNLDELPPYLPDALLATEDRRFYSHFGIDPRGLLRAIVTNIEAGHLVQGGSTITQQLAKNVFLTPDRTVRRKGQEVLLALWLEHSLTKQQILTLYLNRVYFGAGTYGVDAAAQKYFGKPAAKVSPFEAAMLAGMVKAPSRYNPLSDPKRATDRAKQVLASMVDAGYMTDGDASRAIAQGVANLKTPTAASGQYYADWVLDQVIDYVNYADRDLVVVTTIDARAQQIAEAVIAKTLSDADAAKNANQAALVAMSPDGAVRAMVGGRDYGASQFNRATQALRPPGSSFKLVRLSGGDGSRHDAGRHDGRRADLHRQLAAGQLRRQILRHGHAARCLRPLAQQRGGAGLRTGRPCQGDRRGAPPRHHMPIWRMRPASRSAPAACRCWR